MRKAFVLAAAVLLGAVAAPAPFTGQAHAAMLVLGGGMAEDCYKAAKREASDSGTLRTCTQALEEEPLSPRDRASTFVNRGVVLISRRAYDDAVADFNRALAIKPGLAEAVVNRGAARLGLHQYSEALSDLDRGLSLGALAPEKAWYDKGLAHEALGDVKAAYFDYRKAAELKPGWAAPQKELERFSVHQG